MENYKKERSKLETVLKTIAIIAVVSTIAIIILFYVYKMFFYNPEVLQLM